MKRDPHNFGWPQQLIDRRVQAAVLAVWAVVGVLTIAWTVFLCWAGWRLVEWLVNR